MTQQESYFPPMGGVTHVPYPDSYRPRLVTYENGDAGDAVVDYIEYLFHIVPPPHFFPRLRKLCDENGILLIADEVQSGVGRTGKMWAIEHEGVEPDIVCSAKGIAGGVPLGAMIARQSIMSEWDSCAHGNTYGGNALGCAAALKTLELVEGKYMQNAAVMGKYLVAQLN